MLFISIDCWGRLTKSEPPCAIRYLHKQWSTNADKTQYRSNHTTLAITWKNKPFLRESHKIHGIPVNLNNMTVKLNNVNLNNMSPASDLQTSHFVDFLFKMKWMLWIHVLTAPPSINHRTNVWFFYGGKIISCTIVQTVSHLNHTTYCGAWIINHVKHRANDTFHSKNYIIIGFFFSDTKACLHLL